MKIRILILLLLLILRLAFNYLKVNEYKDNSKIRLVGDIDKIVQNTSKCIISIDIFVFESDGYCQFSQGDKISVIGTTTKRLIDNIFGNIWLSSAVIDKITTENSKPITEHDLGDFFSDFRENLSSKLSQSLPARESALLAGIVLGDKKGITREFYQEMVNSGTIHIVVASGYNILLVGGTLLSLLFWIGKRKIVTWIAIIGMIFYALLSGGEAPVVRAVIMASMVYVGAVMGRRQLSWWALLLAGWIMILFDISILKSASFQLSMSASVGLMIVEPWIRERIDRLNSRMIQIFIDVGLLTTISTMLVTAPVIWWHFGRFNPVGLISNIFILPLVPPLMILGVLVLLFSGVFSLPTYLLAHLAVLVINIFGR